MMHGGGMRMIRELVVRVVVLVVVLVVVVRRRWLLVGLVSMMP